MSNSVKDNDAVALLRVSSHRQADNFSHETQLKEIQSYCVGAGLNLIKATPIVESAKDSDNRKQYNREIEEAVKKGIKHIIFYQFDREARNLTDNERNEKLVKAGILSVHYAHDKKVYNQDTSDSDFYLRDITAAGNKQFVRNLGTKINGGTKTKAEKGWFPSSQLPLGYIHFRPTNASGREIRRMPTTIITDPNTKVVEMIQREFALRARNYSYDKIRTTIIEEGLIEDENKYLLSGIEKRLKNKFYRGFFDWQGTEYKGSHELIINQDILDAVDASFKEKLLQTIIPENKTFGIFGGGYLKCKTCGCNIVHEHKRKINKNGVIIEYDLYRCSNGKHQHNSLKGLYVTELDIWNTFSRAVDEISITKALADKINDTLNATHIKAKEARRREINNYSQTLELIDAKGDKLFDMYTQGLVDKDEYRRQSDRLKEERRNYTQLLQNISADIDDKFFETISTTIELAINAKLLWNLANTKKRKELLDELLSNRHLNYLNNATIEYDLKSPFKELAELRKNNGKDGWCTARESNPQPPVSKTDALSS